MPAATGALDALSRFGLNRQNAPHLLELAGLGALSVPVAHHMMQRDSSTTDRAMNGLELGGLGLLAVPSLMHLRR